MKQRNLPLDEVFVARDVAPLLCTRMCSCSCVPFMPPPHRYLRLSRAVHPDAGGSDTMFAMLADAYTAANELYGTARTTSDL